jgi:hypothetical protein
VFDVSPDTALPSFFQMYDTLVVVVVQVKVLDTPKSVLLSPVTAGVAGETVTQSKQQF